MSIRVFDGHVHFGLWRKKLGPNRREELYYSPIDVVGMLNAADVQRFACSCTSVQDNKIDRGEILDAYRQMCSLAEGRCYPLLWVTDRMFDADPDLKDWLPTDIPWAGLKLHNEESDWLGFDRLERILSIAQERELVVQVHTGPNRSQAGRFGYYCEKFPNVRFLLAHARPIDEAIDLAKNLPNVWLDTSFVEDEALQKVADAGLSNRLVFGSDMPVYSHWQRGGYVQLVKDRVATIERIFGEKADDVLFFNFAALFSAADDRRSGADGSSSIPATTEAHKRPKARLSKDNMVRAARLFDETFFPALKGDDRKVAVLTLERGFIPILKGAQRGVEAICAMCREAKDEAASYNPLSCTKRCEMMKSAELMEQLQTMLTKAIHKFHPPKDGAVETDDESQNSK